MKTRISLPAIILLFLSLQAGAQTTKLTRLEIKEKEVYIVGPENSLIVDTLIMQDKATIRFSPEKAGILNADMAIIGENCTISSKGADGLDANEKISGSAGQNGGDLKITIHFDKVGSLTIDTRGGQGGNGLQGKNGAKGIKEYSKVSFIKEPDGKTIRVVENSPEQLGTDGTNATTGFNGGNGGDIELEYSTNNFIPIFNNSKGKNNIFIVTKGGIYGRDGKPGKGGIGKRDGKLIQTNKVKSVDGQIKLKNVGSVPEQEK
ncbi:hypothetical protein [Pontibacter burrus]|uniref:Collagen-like protein n=1 Tax=Pontibacter burrus TaxID=2704466 RepID=A0A6B3LV32_9BACT|nr:hypothetical protein [Pontibacter burrus]NEM98116.1 hypothetical protein [Pontibacter burrus]